MFLGMQDFDFCPNLIKFYPNFTKFTHCIPSVPTSVTTSVTIKSYSEEIIKMTTEMSQ